MVNTALLHKYFRGEATSTEVYAIRAWVMSDAEHAALFKRERRLYDALTLHGEHMINTSDGYVGDHRPLSMWGRSGRGFHPWKVSRVAALVLMVIGFSTLGYGWWLIHRVNTLQEQCRVEVPKGQRTHLVLADGTDVWLNSGSTLTYPAYFGTSERRVRLEGEGYFQVSRDTKRPFRVTHYAGEVEVLGTTFDLIVDSINATYSTSLIKGRVRVTAGDSVALTLRAGQYATLRRGKLQCGTINNYDHFDWRHGYITFTDMTFSHIMQSLERVYGTPIVIDYAAIADERYTGKFRYEDGLDYALRVMHHDIPFRVTRDERTGVVHIEQSE